MLTFLWRLQLRGWYGSLGPSKSTRKSTLVFSRVRRWENCVVLRERNFAIVESARDGAWPSEERPLPRAERADSRLSRPQCSHRHHRWPSCSCLDGAVEVLWARAGRSCSVELLPAVGLVLEEEPVPARSGENEAVMVNVRL